METGTHSIWVSEQLLEMGHEVIVANVRELRAISHSNRKSDTVDAEKIARYARVDPEIFLSSHGCPTGSSDPDSCPQPDGSSADSGGELSARPGEALRLSASSFVHLMLRQAMHGCAAARSGSGAWSSARTDRCDDGEDPAVRSHHQANCFVRQKVCELQISVLGLGHYDPDRLQSGTLKSGKGNFLHEDLGASTFAGMPVHNYRDTTTLNTGVLGNDAPMATVREFSYSPELGFNLASSLDSAQVGHQVFTVTDLNTNEPDPKFFEVPEGYRIIDRRKAKPAAPKQ